MHKILSDFCDTINWVKHGVTTFEDVVKSFLDEDISRKIIIESHVNGYRVTIKHGEYGDIVFATGERPPYPHMVVDCIKYYNINIKKKENERIESLQRRKREIQKELKEVSEELKNITLKTFSDDYHH